MDLLVGGATKVKTLVSIWRPEFERYTCDGNGVTIRSGRHFIYAYKYVMYYIQLLEVTKDLDTLRLIAPKVRKASSSVVNHSKVWEYLCTTYLRVPLPLNLMTVVITKKVGNSSGSGLVSTG
jgi:hypothetical protein